MGKYYLIILFTINPQRKPTYFSRGSCQPFKNNIYGKRRNDNIIN